MSALFILSAPGQAPEHLGRWPTGGAVAQVRSAVVVELERLRPGVLTTEVVEAVTEVSRRYGYERHTYFGILRHGLGTDLHEAPTIGEKVAAGRPPERLEPGMVIALEPGVLLPGVGGGHLEDVALVTDADPEILTRTPFLTEYLS